MFDRIQEVPGTGKAPAPLPVASSPHTPTGRGRTLDSFPAGAPRGSWPAEAFAREQRNQGVPVDVVMDLDSDMFLVIAKAVA